jgi:hypothetical protein
MPRTAITPSKSVPVHDTGPAEDTAVWADVVSTSRAASAMSWSDITGCVPIEDLGLSGLDL